MAIGFQGDFTYLTDQPGPGVAERVTQIYGPVARRRRARARPPAPAPLFGNTAAFLRDAGENDLELIGFENGHLIALELGGPNLECNIAPMFSYVNQVSYRTIEAEITARVSITHVRISVDYRADLVAIPEMFTVDVQEGAGAGWTRLRTLAMATAVPSPFPIPGGEWDGTVAVIRANLPAHKGATPYAFLEPLRGQLGLPPSQPTTHFSARERTIIMIANALYDRAAGEAGFLRSDQPGSDPFHTLVRMGGNNRPQVDHIRPRSWGGSNSFANAQLVSLKENKSKLAQVTADQAAEALANRHIPPKRAASGDGHAAKRTRYV